MVEGELETSREAIVGGMEGRSTAHRCCRRGQRETRIVHLGDGKCYHPGD